MLDKIHILSAHKLQAVIEADTHRFRVLACGRRWGKSICALREAFQMVLEGFNRTKEKQRGWVVAPTFPLVREDWMIAEELLKDAITDKKLTDMRMDFGALGFLEFKSAERDDEGLRGAGLNFCVVDEASRVSKKSWEQGLRPALSDKLGKAIFISTPKGRNWFYELWLKGQSPNDEIKSWKYPTYTNPFFPQEEWQTILKTTPEMTRKQEYEADFLEDEGSVFKNISSCLRGSFEEPVKGELYTIGVDLGKAVDFTVITVIRNSTRQVVGVHRFNKVDWSLQKKQIISIYQKYPSIVWLDSTGLGDPIEEDLRANGVNTKDFKFTNSSKEELVKGLIVAIEQGLVGIPSCPQTEFLIEELKAFSYEILPSRAFRYSAPEGLHDDGVISLGLSVAGIAHLLHIKKPVIQEKRPWGTADDWERMYKSLEPSHVFETRDQVLARISRTRIRRLLQRV